MTLKSNARLAGLMFLIYIATGIPEMIFYSRATAGGNPSARLASIAAHLSDMRIATILAMLTIVDALLLAVALYAITRSIDRDLSLLALTFRLIEAATNTIPAIAKVGLLAVVTAGASTTAADAAAQHAIAAFLLKIGGWTMPIGATMFAIGSTIYCWLFLRARSIPQWLSWLGIAASILLVVAIPLQGVRLIRGGFNATWIPMFIFEVAIGIWLIVKGVQSPAPLLRDETV